jgi:hypothetical protein
VTTISNIMSSLWTSSDSLQGSPATSGDKRQALVQDDSENHEYEGTHLAASISLYERQESAGQFSAPFVYIFSFFFIFCDRPHARPACRQLTCSYV